MKLTTLLIGCLLIAMFALTGCKGAGGGTFGSSFSAAGGSSGSSGGGSGGGSPIGHSPEPATIALLGGGLAAYAFLKRKRKK